MYPQGGYRNPYTIYGIGDRSQTSRQPSRLGAPTSQTQPQPQQQQQIPKPEAKKEEPSKLTQPARVPTKPEPQVPKQAESKPEQQKVTVTETKKESPTPAPTPPPPAATAIVKLSTPTQSLNLSASENNKKEELSIVPADQGKAIVKGSSSEPEKSLQRGIKEDITNLSRRLAELQAQHKLLNGDQRPMPGQSDLGVRVITLAGENRGATMDLGSEARNNAIYDSQKVDHKDSTMNEKDANGKGIHSPSVAGPVNAYVNSNVQASNNSLLYNSTCAHRDPGVHLGLSNTPFHAHKLKESAPPKETRAKLKAVKDSA